MHFAASQVKEVGGDQPVIGVFIREDVLFLEFKYIRIPLPGFAFVVFFSLGLTKRPSWDDLF